MSSRNLRLELSERARRDFRDILSYTLKIWGERQLADYRSKLDSALRAIAQDPAAGRQSVKPGLMVVSAGKHRIFYRSAGTAIYVIRILHERMDLARLLAEADFSRGADG